MDHNPEDTKGLHLPSTPRQNRCTRLTLAYSIYPEWGWPVMTWDPYCTPPEVTPIARLGQLRKHQAVTHPSTNLATPCLTSVISRELVYPKCYALVMITTRRYGPQRTSSSGERIWPLNHFFTKKFPKVNTKNLNF